MQAPDLRYHGQRQRSLPRGLDRFLEGERFPLSRLIEATASSPEAFEEISRERVERMHADRDAERRRVAEARQ